MNKIFKVIYSKVRNCYVVTSEFAKANTKSSTGSAKCKTGKKALLTLAVASAIMCGGLMNVGATVHVEEVPSGTKTVYETTEVDSKLNDKLDKTQAENTYGKATDVATNAAGIQTNKSSIDKLTAEKMDTSTADAKYATKTEVNAKADQSALDNLNTTVVADGNRITALETGKADATDVAANTDNIAKNTADIAKKIDKDTADATYAKSSEVYTKTEVNDALTAASTNVNTKLADYAKTADVNAELAKKADTDSVYSKTEANNTFTTKDELNATKTELEGKITNNTTNITSNKEAIDDLKTKVGDATGGLTKTVNDLTGKVNTVESDITNLKDKDVALEGKINANSNDITGLKDKDVELEDKINTAKSELNAKIDNTKTELSNADTALDTKITANKDKIQQNTDNIAANKTAIDTLKNNVGTVTGGDYLDGSDTIAGNLGRLNTGLTDEVAARTAADTALGGRIDTEKSEREAADTAINAKIGTIDDVQTNYVKNANSISQNLTKLDKELKDTNDRTAGIKRDDVHNETVIEGKVTIDQDGNVSKVKDLGAEKVTTGSLETTGKSELKGDVTLGTDVNNTVTVNGKTTFKENVKVEKDLTVDGKLNVGEIAMKNDNLDADGKKHDSATTITADGISNIASVKESGKTTESQFTHNEKGTFNHAKEGDSTDWKEATSNVTANGVGNIAKDSQGNNNTFTQTSTETKNTLADKDNKNTNEFTQTATDTTNTLTDADKNTSSTRQDAKGNYGYAKDKDGNKSYTKQEGNRLAESVIGKDGKETKSEMTTTDITNTAKSGTIKNDAKDIENKATNEITNEAGQKITDKVGSNTRITDISSIKDSVGTDTSREMTSGKITDTAGDSSVTTENGKGTTFTKTGSIAFSDAADAPTDTNISGNKLTTGRVESNELKVSDKDGTNTADLDVKAGEGVTASASNGTTTGSFDVKADEVGSSVKDATGGTNGSSFRQRIDAIMGNVKSADGESEVIQKGNQITSEVGKGESTSSKVTQTKDMLQTALTDGTNYNVSQDAANASAKLLTDGTKTNKTQDNLDSSERKLTNGTYETSSLQTALDITNTAKDGTIKNDAKDIENIASGNIKNSSATMDTIVTGEAKESYGKLTTTIENDESHTVKGNQSTTVEGDVTEDYKKNLTTTVGGDELHEVTGTKTETVTGKVTENFNGGQETNVTGDQTTTVSGTQTTTATDINRNASSGMIDTIDNAYGTNKETKVAGKTTTEVTIKGTGEKGEYIRGANEAKDTLTKGTLKNSETKTAEATSTEITDGTNKSSTIQDKSNLAGSVTNGTETGVSGIHGNADGSVSIDSSVADTSGNISTINQKKGSITSAVSDGTNATVINQDKNNVTIASNNGTIAMGGKDIINNATDAITNTAGISITNQVGGSKMTADANGTTFTHTEANTALTSKKDLGENFTNTTIKGNTITTGQVTMDYAEVMKDLGVKGNANITGKTTTGSLEVTGTSTLKGDVTMENNATVKKDLTVKGTTTTKDLHVTNNATVEGTLTVTKEATFQDSVTVAKDLSVGGNATITGDVTANSYKVGNNTYIDSNGINANGQVIRNVGAGEISETSTDAVNGSQLFATNRRIEQFDSRINEVGANAAAIANLHPMEFDADSKLNVAVGVGNYRNKTATAMGVFYRPNEDVMFNVSSTIGSNDNMVGGGISFRLGSGGNKQKNKALADAAEQNKQLKSQVDTLQAQMDALLSVINPNMSKDFPDVPDNHWAYEAVSRLAGNDIIQGYEDGKYHGERTMTRYEMAAIIYKALQKGAKAEAKLVEEFKPELKALAAHEKA